jgi:mannose-6-phosphate isomerase-like protein (cupin superfamily)
MSAAGDGWAVSSLDELGDGPGFRKVRQELGVSEFGVNAIVMPSGFGGSFHSHERQQELYFVYKGRARFEFGDGSSEEVGPGALVRVDAATNRRYESVGHEDLVLLAIGGAGGYVGRDGVALDPEQPRVKPNE